MTHEIEVTYRLLVTSDSDEETLLKKAREIAGAISLSPAVRGEPVNWRLAVVEEGCREVGRGYFVDGVSQ